MQADRVYFLFMLRSSEPKLWTTKLWWRKYAQVLGDLYLCFPAEKDKNKFLSTLGLNAAAQSYLHD